MKKYGKFSTLCYLKMKDTQLNYTNTNTVNPAFPAGYAHARGLKETLDALLLPHPPELKASSEPNDMGTGEYLCSARYVLLPTEPFLLLHNL